MKKTILILLLAGLGLVAAAQPRAIGLRGGYGLELSYQHALDWPHFVEVDLGLDLVGDNGFRATATYNIVVAQPDWTSVGEWTWYVGPGASLGYVSELGTDRVNVMAAAVVQVGCEYSPTEHLGLSLDMRPMFGFHFGTGKFYSGGMLGLIPTLGVRFKF